MTVMNIMKSNNNVMRYAADCLRISDFMKEMGVSIFSCESMGGDASKRKYWRIKTPEQNFILMDSIAELNSLRKSLEVSDALLLAGFRVPQFIHHNMDLGMAFLEDFGDCSLNSYMTRFIDSRADMYKKSVDVLTALQQSSISLDLPIYTPVLMDRELDNFINWYVNPALIVQSRSAELVEAKMGLFAIFHDLYKNIYRRFAVFTHRDYHVDNLMVLKQDATSKSGCIGILDFQDAVRGAPAYDLVSLLMDARCDVDNKMAADLIKYFVTENGYNYDEFSRSYHILGLQRNLKIIGLFHKFSQLMHRRKYLDYCPRVWRYIEQSMQYLSVNELEDWFKKYKIHRG